ncbi:leukocyte elastase inhibitor-like protein, partial [Dinothrombium tinctorium]
EWVHGFNPNKTQKAKFYNHDHTESEVDTMANFGKKYKYLSDSNKKLNLVELPYKGNLSMILLVPQQRYGLEQVLGNLTSDELENLLSSAQLEEIALKVPKFNSDHKLDGKIILQKMGLTSIFEPGADFSGISPGAYISLVMHKAKVRVDEVGTVAAAVTGVTESRIALFSPLIEVIVDHPFAYIIRDQSNGLNLFYGTVNKL